MSQRQLNVVMLAVIGFQVFVLLEICFESGTSATIVSNTCCTPAHLEVPVVPPQGNASCSYNPNDGKCYNGVFTNKTCTGAAYQVFALGNCLTPATGKNCNPPPAVLVILIATSGTFSCQVTGGTSCVCQWNQDPPATATTITNNSVPSCNGDPCP
jgi:hypothetical protein